MLKLKHSQQKDFFEILGDPHQLGYETLVEEVADHTKWRRFCQIPLDKKVPDSTTLIKLTQKYGPEMIKAVNLDVCNDLGLAVRRRLVC